MASNACLARISELPEKVEDTNANSKHINAYSLSKTGDLSRYQVEKAFDQLVLSLAAGLAAIFVHI